jgi:drug/metabolite transporter (DMT)-like permease
MAMMADRRKGVLLLIGATLAWSTAGLFARSIHMDAPTMTLWRAPFGALGLLAVIGLMQGRDGFRDFGRLGRAGVGYAAASGIGMIFFMAALKGTTIAHVSIIYATLPFVAGAIGWAALRERPGSSALCAALLALIGSVVMVGLGGDGRFWGDVMSFGMVASMAVMIVIARARPALPTMAAGTLAAILTPLACVPFANLTVPDGSQLLLLAGFGLFNTTMGFALFIVGSRYLPPVETALISALEVPMTPFWVWLVFAETPTLPTLIGGALVMAAVLGHILWQAKGGQPRP